jgi:hypothetical protein
MGLFDLFKKTAKTIDVSKVFEETLTKQNFAGYPTYKTSSNFYVSPYNYTKKANCGFDMKVVNKFKIDYAYRFDAKKKELGLTVWFFDLTIDGKVEQEALRKTFPAFRFGFLPSAVTVFCTRTCKTLDEVKKAVAETRELWNNSSVFELMKAEFSPNPPKTNKK